MNRRRPGHVHAHAQVGILHDGQLNIVATNARKVGRAAEQRLVAKQQLGAPASVAQCKQPSSLHAPPLHNLLCN
jgi:hypothetical protein